MCPPPSRKQPEAPSTTFSRFSFSPSIHTHTLSQWKGKQQASVWWRGAEGGQGEEEDQVGEAERAFLRRRSLSEAESLAAAKAAGGGGEEDQPGELPQQRRRSRRKHKGEYTRGKGA